jgi:tetratricopeptide (TPR) repeat protein
MKKENILYSVIGVLVGFIVGFAFANSSNMRGYAAQKSGAVPAAQQQGLPPNHPPVDASAAAAEQVDPAKVESALKLAREQPDNFDAQLLAANIAYSAHRYDDATAAFAAANKIRPDDYEVLVGLGNTNFDAGKFEDAGKWYEQALRRQPNDVSVRTDLGLTFYFREPRDLDRAVREYRASLERDPDHVQTLQNLTVALTAKGDAAAARTTLAKLDKLSAPAPKPAADAGGK